MGHQELQVSARGETSDRKSRVLSFPSPITSLPRRLIGGIEDTDVLGVLPVLSPQKVGQIVDLRWKNTGNGFVKGKSLTIDIIGLGFTYKFNMHMRQCSLM